jgi:hypothetical protein
MKQTKPFIVEIKPSRKLKPGAPKQSIWGKLDLKADEPPVPDPHHEQNLATADSRNQSCINRSTSD